MKTLALFLFLCLALMPGCGDCGPRFDYEWSARPAHSGSAIVWANATGPPAKLGAFIGRAAAHELGGRPAGVLELDQDEERAVRDWLKAEWARQVGTPYNYTSGTDRFNPSRAVVTAHGVQLELYESSVSHSDVVCPAY